MLVGDLFYVLSKEQEESERLANTMTTINIGSVCNGNPQNMATQNR